MGEKLGGNEKWPYLGSGIASRLILDCSALGKGDAVGIHTHLA